MVTGQREMSVTGEGHVDHPVAVEADEGREDRSLPAFGGQDTVKQPLGEELLFGKLEKGGKVTIDAQDAEIVDEATGETKPGKKLAFRYEPAVPAAPPAEEKKAPAGAA